MNDVLSVILFVGVAWFISHSVFERLQSRFLFTTGAEYIVLGIFLGPLSPVDLVNADFLVRVQPLIALAIGWLGLVYGMGANLREVFGERDGVVTLTFWEVFISLSLVSMTIYWLLGSGFVGVVDEASRQLATFVLAASAAVGSRGAIELVQRRHNAEGRLTQLLTGTARFGELLAIIAFGTIFCLYHADVWVPFGDDGRFITALEWLVITVGMGAILGLLCRGLLEEEDEDQLFLALLGTIVFASGTAYYLQLSPLLLNLSLGVVLVNLLPNAEEVRQALMRAYRPMVIILLIFAGALWILPDGRAATLLILLYIVGRGGAKMLGGWLAARALGPDVRRDMGRGLLGHGEVAVAMAISFSMAFAGNPDIDSHLVQLVYTAILTSVMLSDLWAPTLLKRTLIDGGEIVGARTVVSESA